MTNLLNHKQSSGSDDHLIGTLVCRLSVISSLTGSVASRYETEAYFNHVFRTFDWNEIIDPLRVSQTCPLGAIGEDNSARDHFVALIGQTYRVSPESQKLSLIWNLGDILSQKVPRQFHTSSDGTWGTESSQSNSPGSAHTDCRRHTEHAVALYRYTSMLHERAQRENIRFQRISEETISLDPPSFEVTVQYGDVTCSGRARTKREAGHLAAREIYNQLNENI